MDIKEHIDYWLKSAAHDMEVAETLFQNQKYDWCLFIGHLVIEKSSKPFMYKAKKKSHHKFTIWLGLQRTRVSPLRMSN